MADDREQSANEQQRLRHVETDVLIPKIMREKAKDLCKDYVKAFHDCCKGRTVSMTWACRKENNAMKECMASYFNDSVLYEECKKEYLHAKEEFERTGVKQKLKRM